MNASPSQPHPAEWTETQGLLPSVERDLPAGRHQFHKEQMMVQIREDLRNTAVTPVRRNPFLRRAVLLPALACALAGAVVGGLALTGGDANTSLATGPALTTRIGAADARGADRLLDDISLAAADTSEPTVRDDQFLYIASKVASTYERTVDDKTTLVSQKLHSRQVWESPDGKDGWLVEPGNTDEGGITLAGPNPVSSAYDRLTRLPTDPEALLRKIYKESDAVRDPEVPRDQAAFVAIGDLLVESYPPADLTVALYKAAADIPGVVAVDDAVDAVGRHGVAVARLDEQSGQRTEWIFDKKTYAFLGERTVQVEPNETFKKGTVIFTVAITQRAVVNEMKEVPGRAG
ncbi:CU044_5270 family protein [Streptomyces pseudovenezuelae]|uniref:CU044_5270 family protein n=1 Tax=Streptomyces pseudovenezuelae TaxID=67350 RepID=UPI002E823C95|nr:CU044_5270 family protein [Streptomyces pseudovenezuelae]WUA89318.1 CU044_5270 family protein [Streptomyces pseudovenezuelae]